MSDEPGAGADAGGSDSMQPGEGTPSRDEKGGGCLSGFLGVGVGIGVVALCWPVGQWSVEAAVFLWLGGVVLAVLFAAVAQRYFLGGGVMLGLLTVPVLLVIACFASLEDMQGLDRLPERNLAMAGSELTAEYQKPTSLSDTQATLGRSYRYRGDAEAVLAYYDTELTKVGWTRTSIGSATSRTWSKGKYRASVTVRDVEGEEGVVLIGFSMRGNVPEPLKP